MITATIDISAVKAKLNGSSSKVLSALRDSLEIQMGNLRSYITREKLSGQVLKRRTGHLSDSVIPTVSSSGDVLTGKVYVDSTAPYGFYQEYGAHIPERVPVNKKALRWYAAGGSPVFAMYARAFDLPPRPFMGPSLDEKSADISAALNASAGAALNK